MLIIGRDKNKCNMNLHDGENNDENRNIFISIRMTDNNDGRLDGTTCGSDI